MQFQNYQIFPYLICQILGLIALLFVQVYFVLKQNKISKKRKSIRLVLNLLLFGLVSLWIYQPEWNREEKNQNIILKSDDVSADFSQKMADSLAVKSVLNQADFERTIKLHPDYLSSINEIHLVGQSFKPELLSRIVAKKLFWQPFFKQNSLQNLQWQGILRKSETQEISGKIEVDSPKDLLLKFGKKTLDSIRLSKGTQSFKLRFPIFSLGKTEIDLFLDEKLIENIHFFVDKTQPYNVLMVLESQDFESKILADYLAKNGHSVAIKTTVAKNTLSTISINQNASKTPDLLITTPANIGYEAVKNAISQGKNVLFFNFINPEDEVLAINTALKTSFKMKRLSNEKELKINENLTTFPFEFQPKINQKQIKDLPIIIQQNKSKIGLSLLNQTYQMQLSGDSLAYQKTWNGIFEMLRPNVKNSFSIQAPILMHQEQVLGLNSTEIQPKNIVFSENTFAFHPSTINTNLFESKIKASQSDWQNITDSSSIYIENSPNFQKDLSDIKSFLNTYNQLFKVDYKNKNTSKNTIPNWVWLLAFLICFTAVWIEPKL